MRSEEGPPVLGALGGRRVPALAPALRDTEVKLQALPLAKKGFAHARNSSRVHRSVASVPRKTASGVK